MSPIMTYFPLLNFVTTDTELFNKSVLSKRLLFKQILLILAEPLKTVRARHDRACLYLTLHDGVHN